MSGETRLLSSTACSCLEADSLAALAMREHAKQSRQMAREMRKEEQAQRVELMRQAAAKLREMASSAIGSALWQGVAGLASAACGAVSAGRGFKAETCRSGNVPAAGLKLSAGIWNVAGKLSELNGRLDPLALHSQSLSADKQRLEADAEACGQRAGEQGDFESEARRLEQSAGELLQKAGEARHAARMAAIYLK
jgi:hypothetical protein